MKTLINWLRWPVALGILAYMFSQHREGFDRIAQRELLWSWVAAAVFFRAFSVVLGCWRWWMLVRAQDIPFAFRDSLRIGCMGNLFNLIVPGTVGGDLTKAVLIAREKPEAKTVVTTTVVLDRVMGLLCLLLLGFLMSLGNPSLWVKPELWPALMLLGGGTLAGAIGSAIVLHPAVLTSKLSRACLRLVGVDSVEACGSNSADALPRGSRLNEDKTQSGVQKIVTQLLGAVRLYQERKRVIFGAVLMSLVIHAANATSYFCCTAALGLTNEAPSYATHLVVVPVAEVAASVLPLPGGIGAREGALQVLFVACGEVADLEAARNAGFYTAVGYSLASVIAAVIGGLVAMSLKPAEARSNESQQRLMPATA